MPTPSPSLPLAEVLATDPDKVKAQAKGPTQTGSTSQAGQTSGLEGPALVLESAADSHRRPGAIEGPAGQAARHADAVLAEAPVVEFRALGDARLMQLLRGDDVLRRLDEIQRHLLEESEAHQALIAKMVAATGGLSIGYVIWLVRGGVLVSSMLSALPAWQMIDPLPVLAAAGAFRAGRDGTGPDDADVERLFDDEARPAPDPEPEPVSASRPSSRSWPRMRP